ncbi:hypothetical protein ACMD2_01566 [Ananas comosus]|uniref:Uncharacterized protein n=1 Tax=Ananas comosus TaxID=4615 RepID=A0A199W0C1_ANACO|nr:hypothetical protein ACMD2_01566 [Ananas comosus]
MAFSTSGSMSSKLFTRIPAASLYLQNNFPAYGDAAGQADGVGEVFDVDVGSLVEPGQVQRESEHREVGREKYIARHAEFPRQRQRLGSKKVADEGGGGVLEGEEGVAEEGEASGEEGAEVDFDRGVGGEVGEGDEGQGDGGDGVGGEGGEEGGLRRGVEVGEGEEGGREAMGGGEPDGEVRQRDHVAHSRRREQDHVWPPPALISLGSHIINEASRSLRKGKECGRCSLDFRKQYVT